MKRWAILYYTTSILTLLHYYTLLLLLYYCIYINAFALCDFKVNTYDMFRVHIMHYHIVHVPIIFDNLTRELLRIINLLLKRQSYNCKCLASRKIKKPIALILFFVVSYWPATSYLGSYLLWPPHTPPPPHIPPNEFGLPVFVFKNCIVYFYISIIYFNFNILHTFFFLQQISSPDGKYIVMWK